MKYICDVCGWEYDEAVGDPEHGIAPGTSFDELPEDFACPLPMSSTVCSASTGKAAARAYPSAQIFSDRS